MLGQLPASFPLQTSPGTASVDGRSRGDAGTCLWGMHIQNGGVLEAGTGWCWTRGMEEERIQEDFVAEPAARVFRLV